MDHAGVSAPIPPVIGFMAGWHWQKCWFQFAFTVQTVQTKFGQLILRKIIKIVVTRCQILRLKCTKFDFGWGSAPDPAGGAYSAPPDLLAGFGALLLREGEEREGREGKQREGEGLKPPQSKFSGYVAGYKACKVQSSSQIVTTNKPTPYCCSYWLQSRWKAACVSRRRSRLHADVVELATGENSPEIKSILAGYLPHYLLYWTDWSAYHLWCWTHKARCFFLHNF